MPMTSESHPAPVLVRLSSAQHDELSALWQAAGLPIKPGGRDSRAGLITQMASGTQTLLGLRIGERLIGAVVLTHDGRKGWINRLAIHPDYRRQGYAQRLIAAGERVLREQGMQVIAALVEDWNDASLDLFEQAGYQRHDDIHYFTKRDAHDV